MLAQAYVYPARMRATRDLLRRRMRFVRYRADLPLIPAHLPDPVVGRIVELDTNVIDHLDEQLRVLAQDLAMKAKAHAAFAYHL